MQPPQPQPSTVPAKLRRPTDAEMNAPAGQGPSVSDAIDEALRARNLQPKLPSGFTDTPQPDPSRATGAPLQVAPSTQGGNPAPTIEKFAYPEAALEDLLESARRRRDAQLPPRENPQRSLNDLLDEILQRFKYDPNEFTRFSER